jgi:polyisoprenoid-binding protein YceI
MTTKSLSIDNSSSEVFFSVKKLGFLTIKGTISGFKGTIAFDQSDLSNSSFDVCVSAKTITTGNPKRDEHLKSKDFFSIEEHSTICFKSSTIKSQNGQYIAIGKLSILNIIQEIEIPFQYQEGVFKGLFSLNRLDYNLGSKFPAFIVGKTIQVSINCKLIS